MARGQRVGAPLAHIADGHRGDLSVGAAGGEEVALATWRGQDDLTDPEGLKPYLRDEDVRFFGIRDEFEEDRAELAASMRSASWGSPMPLTAMGEELDGAVAAEDHGQLPCPYVPSPYRPIRRSASEAPSSSWTPRRTYASAHRLR